MWLDELQRYLDGEHGLTGGVVRALLTAPGPVVIIGTLWPDRYAAYTAVARPGGADPHAREREVLDLAEVIRIGPEFSPAEQDRARAAAARDPRLALALEAAGYGLTQTLAAAPQLVARWQDAQAADPYAWAVLTAALDAARLGARAPLSAGFLRAAAPGYCTSAQQAEAPDNWFEQALAYATAKLHGAAAALAPAGTGMGQVAGYTVADYLIQHASRERRDAACPPAPGTPSSATSAIPPMPPGSQTAPEAGCCTATPSRCTVTPPTPAIGTSPRGWLTCWPTAADLDELRTRADAGDGYVAMLLAILLADRGDLDELRARADADDQFAAMSLTILLSQRGDVDELRARADAGDQFASKELAHLLAGLGDLDQPRARGDAGDRFFLRMLAGLLAERGRGGDVDEPRARADAGGQFAAAAGQPERGDLDEPARPRRRRRRDCRWAAGRPAGRARGRGRAARPRRRWRLECRLWLARLLARRGELDELRARADAGDPYAAAGAGRPAGRARDLEELRTRADTDDQYAAKELARLHRAAGA